MSTSTDPIITVAVSDGYFSQLSQSDKSSFLMDPASFVEGHPYIQSAYPDLWAAYQANLNDHGTGYATTTSNGNTSTSGSGVDFGGTVPSGGVAVPGENPSYNFEAMFPKQTAQLINLGDAETQLSQAIAAVQANLTAFESQVDPKLVSLGTADNTLSSGLNNEISYINTKFTDIDAKLSSLGTSVSQASTAGSNPFGSITSFFSKYGVYLIIIVIIAVVLGFIKR